jgi:hypothetical protein
LFASAFFVSWKQRFVEVASHVDRNSMSANRHNAQDKGANPRDRVHPRRQFLKHAHRDWRVWFAVRLMLALMGVYAMTAGLSRIPGMRPTKPIPENNAP